MSKKFGSLSLTGSTQEKLASRFSIGYGKTANDKKVPDRVDSAVTANLLGGPRRMFVTASHSKMRGILPLDKKNSSASQG
jgi:hypothetical protein